jgi:hypothetical protein
MVVLYLALIIIKIFFATWLVFTTINTIAKSIKQKRVLIPNLSGFEFILIFFSTLNLTSLTSLNVEYGIVKLFHKITDLENNQEFSLFIGIITLTTIFISFFSLFFLVPISKNLNKKNYIQINYLPIQYFTLFVLIIYVVLEMIFLPVLLRNAEYNDPIRQEARIKNENLYKNCVKYVNTVQRNINLSGLESEFLERKQNKYYRYIKYTMEELEALIKSEKILKDTISKNNYYEDSLTNKLCLEDKVSRAKKIEDKYFIHNKEYETMFEGKNTNP